MFARRVASIVLLATLLPPAAATAVASPLQCGPLHTWKMERLMEAYRDAVNSHDPEVMAAILPDDYWSVNPLGEFDGLEANLALTVSMIAAFPDIHFSIERVVVRGEVVVLEYSWVGTHLGEVLGIPPTGEVAYVRAVEIHEVEDGVIKRTWNYIDLFGLLAQLGAL